MRKPRPTTTHDCPRCGGKNTLKPSGYAPSGNPRWQCRSSFGHTQGERKRKYCYSTVDPTAPYRDQGGNKKEGLVEKNPQFRRKLGGVKRFVITSAQNATPVHRGFWRALKAYCEENDAELVVLPIRYKNPTSKFSESQINEEFWIRDVALEEMGPGPDNMNPLIWNQEADRYVADKYLYNQRKKLCEHLVLLGDIKVQPTAVRPLSGFEAITHEESGIIGHTKLQLGTVATPQGKLPKIMTTTGACTIPNYTDSKAGKKGEFHHCIGAVAVDIVGSKFFMYQLNATPIGSFQHLDKVYTDQGEVEKNHHVEALVLGDTHRVDMDPDVEKATFDKGGMVDQLKPKYLVFHDLHDGKAVNHHERKNPFSQVMLRQENNQHAEEEVRDDITWLRKVIKGRFCQAVIVPSNHDDFLTRYLVDVDWRKDPDNAEFYLESALEAVRSIKRGGGMIQIFPYWVDRLKGDANIRCLQRDESFQIAGIELGLHGDRGPNGARGSRMNLRRIGVKSIIGHSHSPGIEEGCYQTGTSSLLRLSYNTGPSSWLHTHCVVYPNGKRTLVTIIDGKWRF